jgi:hypothetical protein
VRDGICSACADKKYLVPPFGAAFSAPFFTERFGSKSAAVVTGFRSRSATNRFKDGKFPAMLTETAQRYKI